MKKSILLGIPVILLLLFITMPVYAADIQIKIDGFVIPTDTAPENINNRTMVPLRTISENLGAQVAWSDPQITISNSNTKCVLTLNSDAVVKNGVAEQLDAKPYLKNNRVLVPLRFIAETFGCVVDYKDSAVNVVTDPLEINGIKIQALQYEYHMTMGGKVQQIKVNACNKAMYDLFMANKGNPTVAPAAYSWRLDLDTIGAYYKNCQYDFLDQNGNSIQQFDIYSLVMYDPPIETLPVYPTPLLYDATGDQWYLFSETAFQSVSQQIDTAIENDLVIVISNTIV